jgi:hypothetical protein
MTVARKLERGIRETRSDRQTNDPRVQPPALAPEDWSSPGRQRPSVAMRQCWPRLREARPLTEAGRKSGANLAKSQLYKPPLEMYLRGPVTDA